MSDTERLTMGAAFTALLFFAPAFVFHSAPEFPGSLTGGLLGIAAAVLMVLLLVYPLVKYVAWLRTAVTRVVSLRALLTFHVYAGVIAALLAILHTGHRYQSPLGIALVGSMLLVIVTGFVGRYYLPKVTAELKDHQGRLASLRVAYDRTAATWAARAMASEKSGDADMAPDLGVPVVRLVDGMADLEYAIGSRRAIRAAFIWWIVAHVVATIVMYLLLALHVMGQVYYGLRWLS